MAVKDTNIKKDAKVARECLELSLLSAVSQTGKKVDGVTPGFAFEIVRVEANALTVTATITADVKIGATSALASAVTPVAETPTAATLATTDAARRGSATDTIFLHYTSDGTGAVTNAKVRVWIRPLPLNGEAYAV